jgi:hypothetical protein
MSRTVEFSDNEIDVVKEIFDVLNHATFTAGCNDYYVDNTPENAKLIEKVNECFKDEFDGGKAFNLSRDKKHFIGYDWAMYAYIKEKICGKDS